MRVIKFRGKRTDNSDWVVGYFVKDPAGKCRIYWQPFNEASSNTYHFVHPKTVGQFTGLKDKNGVDIYEGDVVVRKQFTCENNTYIDIYSVIYKEGMFKLEVVRSHIWSKGAIIYLFQDSEVTGNIHDLKQNR